MVNRNGDMCYLNVKNNIYEHNIISRSHPYRCHILSKSKNLTKGSIIGPHAMCEKLLAFIYISAMSEESSRPTHLDSKIIQTPWYGNVFEQIETRI